MGKGTIKVKVRSGKLCIVFMWLEKTGGHTTKWPSTLMRIPNESSTFVGKRSSVLEIVLVRLLKTTAYT